MYPKEKEEEAINLWLKYDKSIASTVRELEWLDSSTLKCVFFNHIDHSIA